MSGELPFTHGALLDALLVDGREHHAVDVDARGVYAVGIESAGGNDFLHLGHGDLAGSRHVRVEVSRGLTEHQVALGISPPGLDDRQVGDPPCPAPIFLAPETFARLALYLNSDV